MKRKIFAMILALSVFTFGNNASAQQWANSGTNIYNTNTGNVGINSGVSFNATERLQVKNGSVLLDYNNAGSTGHLYFGGKPSTSVDGMRLAYFVNGMASTAYFDVRMNSLTKGLSFRVDNTTGVTERLRINANGNIGINTSTPSQRLHVNGNILVDGAQATMLFGGETSGSLSSGEYGIEYIDGTSPSIQHGLNFWKPFGSHDGAGGTGGFRNYILFMNNDGNIGMGVDPANINSAFKLSVCGAIRATKIKVETGWCDFVFEKDYKLMPLSEVEDFILQYKHLPEIPPASEVETNGADLGLLVSKQMQKIEELTLYIIQIKKEMDELKSSGIIK